MEKAALTFAALNQRIDALPVHTSLQMAPARREKWGMIIGLSAGFAGLIAAKLMPSSVTGLVIASALGAVEIVALGIAVIPRRPWHWPSFAAQRREYADQLDFDQFEHDKLIVWLRGFEKSRLQAMTDYATHRSEQLKEKYPLLSGGLDKLGALPVAVALYLQFKDLRWPPHPSWPEIILGILLVLIYWTSLQFASVRFRADLFVSLLTRALAPGTDAEPHDEAFTESTHTKIPVID